jgi:hypothetical protein
LVSCLCTIGGCVVAGGYAGGKGGYVGDLCVSGSAVEVCSSGIGNLSCHNVVSLWGQTYNLHHTLFVPSSSFLCHHSLKS